MGNCEHSSASHSVSAARRGDVEESPVGRTETKVKTGLLRQAVGLPRNDRSEAKLGGGQFFALADVRPVEMVIFTAARADGVPFARFMATALAVPSRQGGGIFQALFPDF